MGSANSISQETVHDVRSGRRPSVKGEGSNPLQLDFQAALSVTNLPLAHKVELIRHLRSEYLHKMAELEDKPTDMAAAPVRPSDVDDLLYAQVELDSLVDDMKEAVRNGPLSVADLSKGVEEIFSHYDTDGMFLLP